jgi:hypothetical protein
MNNLKIYCVTNKRLDLLEKFSYDLGWVGPEKAPENYIKCDNKENIFFKEKYYSELTFHYWYWKNLLNLRDSNWVGFCQKRRFWLKKDSKKIDLNKNNFKDHLLDEAPDEWSQYESIICEPVNVNKVKKIKMLKRGFRSILKKPEIFFNEKKQSIAFHFDMHHGYGNLDKAINLINKKDKDEFLEYVNNSVSYNPHIMFIAKPEILDKWFDVLFSWLLRCESEFGFDNLKGYDTQRLYAYLAERYLSFWFNKYTKVLNWPWAFFDINEK